MSLTDDGLSLINQAIEAHVANQARLVAGLTTDEQNALNQLLKVFLVSLEK